MKHFAFLFLLSGMLLAAPALAADDTAPTDSGTEPAAETQTGLACIQNAIDVRDEAMIVALDTYYNAAKASLETRIVDLKEAWEQPKGTYRKADIKDVWTAYKKQIRIANKEFRLDKRVIWNKFKKDKTACKGVQLSDDTQSQSADTTL